MDVGSNSTSAFLGFVRLVVGHHVITPEQMSACYLPGYISPPEVYWYVSKNV